ncbi:cell division protein ZapA [Novosphingobium sp.]|uniref:cell division protein ZapA n=1 Tax=Novosphingobium sp. TaxID=1874826 RepID=UPI0033429EDD
MTTPTTNVTLNIGGRSHVLAVAPAEIPHITMLAAMIDERMRNLGPGQGQTEARMLLIAALMLADELHGLQTAPPPPPPTMPPSTPTPQNNAIAPELLARVAALADRVEKLAAHLEHSDQDA